MRFTVTILIGCMIPLGAFASPYRDCIKAESEKLFATMECDFSQLNLIRSKIRLGCARKALEALDLRDPDAKAKIDNAVRQGESDVEEFARQRATKCGVTLTIKGDTVTVESSTAK